MQSIRDPTTADYGRLLLVGAIWGSAFLCIEIALTGLPPVTIAASRIAIGALVLALVAWHRGITLPAGSRTWALLILIGFLNSALPFLLISWGQQSIPSARSAILMGSGPFLVLWLSHLTTRDDRLTGHKIGALLLGFTGVATLVGYDAMRGDTASLMGQVAVIGAAACYGISSVLARWIATVPALTSSTIVLASAACYMVPAALLIDRPWTLQPQPSALLALLFLGLFPTALAYLLRFQIIRDTGATFMSQVSYLVPLFAVFWGWLFLAQIPPARAWFALLLIFAGVYLSQHRKQRPALADIDRP